MLDLNALVGTGEGTSMDILALKSELIGAARRTLVLFVELTRASDGTDSVCGFAESKGCDAAVDLRGSSEELGGVHDGGR